MGEGDTVSAIGKLFDGLPDDAARQRVLDWARGKYGAKAMPVAPVPLGPTVAPSPWQPMPSTTVPFVVDTRMPRECAFDGLPPGVYGLMCSCPRCTPQCALTNGTVWLGETRPPPEALAMVYGPGPSLGSKLIFRA